MNLEVLTTWAYTIKRTLARFKDEISNSADGVTGAKDEPNLSLTAFKPVKASGKKQTHNAKGLQPQSLRSPCLPYCCQTFLYNLTTKEGPQAGGQGPKRSRCHTYVHMSKRK